MDDLIRRDAVLDTVVNMRLRCDTNDIDDFCALLLECFAVLPTADLSEYCDKLWKIAYERGKKEASPIRCDECKHWDTEWIPAGGEGHYCPMMDHVMVDKEWCCYGERRKSDG